MSRIGKKRAASGYRPADRFDGGKKDINDDSDPRGNNDRSLTLVQWFQSFRVSNYIVTIMSSLGLIIMPF